MISGQYGNYNESDLHLMMYEPWEISDRPYMLHAAYAISCLHEAVAPVDDDNDEDEKFERSDVWGCTIPQNILKRLVDDITESFNDAASEGRRIDIWGKSYTIRRRNAYDPKRLHLIFDFPLKDGEYVITKEGIRNLAGEVPEVLQKYEATLDEAKANKLYLRQVVMLAEDDKNNGWDKLTDMEIVMYCWALYYNKYQSDNLKEFKRIYKDYLYVKEDELKSCLTDKALFRERPQGMYTFSEAKVKEWNKDSKQKSYAESISKEEADDYWYNKALKTTFKPIDTQ